MRGALGAKSIGGANTSAKKSFIPSQSSQKKSSKKKGDNGSSHKMQQ